MEDLVRSAGYRLRGFLVKLYLQLHGCRVGKNFRCIGFPVFRCVPKSNYFIGDHVTIGCGVIFEVTPEGRIQLDDYALIGDYCTLSAAHSIHLKTWCAIAERVSIRDGFHLMKPDQNYRQQKSEGAPVELGEDSGVGAGTVVLQGTIIPRGTFIGANSLVTQKVQMEEKAIYAGNPLKMIRRR